MNPIEELEQRTALVKEINEILARNGISGTVSLTDITITDTGVSDVYKTGKTLSGLITQHLWPSVPRASVYHYTSRAAAESILNTGIFRLTNIEKRYNEGEIVTF
jgi:hypothetical protein